MNSQVSRSEKGQRPFEEAQALMKERLLGACIPSAYGAKEYYFAYNFDQGLGGNDVAGGYSDGVTLEVWFYDGDEYDHTVFKGDEARALIRACYMRRSSY